MPDLVERIAKLGQRAMQLPSGFSLMERWEQQPSDVLASELFAIFEVMGNTAAEFVQLQRDAQLEHANDVSSSLFPLRLVALDTINPTEFLNASLVLYSMRVLKKSSPIDGFNYAFNEDKEHSFFRNYDHLRLFSRTIAHFATSDMQFISRGTNPTLSATQTGLLVSHDLSEKPSNFCVLDSLTGEFSADEYVALAQLVKNAKRHGYGKIIKSLPSTDACYIALSNERQPENTLMVTDSGTGIAPEVLPTIFDAYSSTGGGLGLQVVRRIAEMRGGYAEVTSTRVGGASHRYATNFLSGITNISFKPLDHGTEVRVYLPALDPPSNK